MRKQVIVSLFCCLLFQPVSFFAGHMVGGEMSYECLGGNLYVIHLTLYRDCDAAPPATQAFDPTANISVYRTTNNQLIKVIAIPRAPDSTMVPIVAQVPCLFDPPDLCIIKMIYSDTVQLSIPPGGVTLINERCCRTPSALNIHDPSLVGSTYTAYIQDEQTITCNNSPVFNAPPPVALCAGFNIQLDYSASDIDGDSIIYRFCNPYQGGASGTGGSGGVPYPDTPSAPPIDTVAWQTGFGLNFQVPSDPAFIINPQTGIVKGKATELGTYIFAVCAQEFRDGVGIGEIRRDFQMTTTTCEPEALSIIDSAIEECIGLEIHFYNQTTLADAFHWDFGDQSTNQDISSDPNPTYTYPDTGVYTVTLVAIGESGCNDTSELDYHVLPRIEPFFERPEPNCYDRQDYDFVNAGYLKQTTLVTWDLGHVEKVLPIGVTGLFNQSFPAVGFHEVTLSYQDFGCHLLYVDTIYVQPNPSFSLMELPESQCAPFSKDYSISMSNAFKPRVEWRVDNGIVVESDTFKFWSTAFGSHSLSIKLTTDSGCIDTISMQFPNHILVLDTPQSGFTLSSLEESMYNPNFTIYDSSRNRTSFAFYLDDEYLSHNPKNEINLEDTGNYIITQITYNEKGCTDTLRKRIRVLPEYLVFTPNAFSPDGDGINDLWFPRVFVWREFELTIYDRWGKPVFQTTDPNDGWNGQQSNQGRESPIGTYAYLINIISPEGQELQYSGQLNLIR